MKNKHTNVLKGRHRHHKSWAQKIVVCVDDCVPNRVRNRVLVAKVKN